MKTIISIVLGILIYFAAVKYGQCLSDTQASIINRLYAKARSQLAHQETKPANKVSQETKSLRSLGDQGISVYNDKWKQGAGIAGDCSIRPVWNSRPEELAEQLWLMLCLCVLNEPSQQEPVCCGRPGAAMHQLQLVVLLLLNLVPLLSPFGSFDTRGWIQSLSKSCSQKNCWIMSNIQILYILTYTYCIILYIMQVWLQTKDLIALLTIFYYKAAVWKNMTKALTVHIFVPYCTCFCHLFLLNMPYKQIFIFKCQCFWFQSDYVLLCYSDYSYDQFLKSCASQVFKSYLLSRFLPQLLFLYTWSN